MEDDVEWQGVECFSKHFVRGSEVLIFLAEPKFPIPEFYNNHQSQVHATGSAPSASPFFPKLFWRRSVVCACPQASFMDGAHSGAKMHKFWLFGALLLEF